MFHFPALRPRLSAGSVVPRPLLPEPLATDALGINVTTWEDLPVAKTETQAGAG